MVSVPEGLERLLADAVVGGGVHQEHAEQHDVAGDTTRLGVVDLDGSDRADLTLLNIVEAIFKGISTSILESGAEDVRFHT